jgi:hypothetical protein
MKTWKFAILTTAITASFGLNACNKSDNNSTPPPVPTTDNNVPQASPTPTPTPAPSATPSPTAMTETLHIRPSMDTCLTRIQQLCLVVEDANGMPERYIDNNIQGFDFKWGHSYVIDVNRMGQVYKLARVVSDQVTRTGGDFTASLDKDAVQTVNSTACDFKYGAVTFTTANATSCAALNAALASGKGFSAHFTFTGDANRPILLQSLDAPGTATWKQLSLHDLMAGEPAVGLCGETAFIILKDGSYSYIDCEKILNQGHITSDELSQIDNLASTLAKSVLLSRACNDTKIASEHDLYLSTDQADIFNIWRADTSGTCFRGELNSTQQLNTLITALKGRYGPIQALPGASPSPTPSPSPTASPAPAPVPTATPVH